jgi:hypothetical protein
MTSPSRRNDHPYVKVSRTINRPAAEAFSYIVPVDLTRIFPRQGDAPGIASATITDDWGTAGQVRTVTWDDGTTLRETMVDVDPGRSFAYRAEEFSAPALDALVERIEGAWSFVENTNGTTSIEWIYSFVPKDDAARPQIEQHLVPAFAGRLDLALSICKEDLESDRPSQ